MSMGSTLLILGDLTMDGTKKAPSVNKFVRYRKRLLTRKIKHEYASYDDLFLKRLPSVSTKKLKVMLFFPFAHWNSNIERYDIDQRIYGDEKFGREYKKFFSKVETLISQIYKNKKIEYINPPASCVLDRDKKRTTQLLNKKGISTPKIYKVSGVSQINRVLDECGALYIKPVFGAMGKGISFITKKDCWTNFVFRNNRIKSRTYDYNWDFTKISQKRRNDFLKTLIKKKFIFEEAINLATVKRRKFDIRVYVIFGKVVYFYAKSAPRRAFVTNWSQGGRIEKKKFLKKAIPEEKIEEIKRVARNAAKIMGLNYAGVDIILDKGLDKVYFLEAHSFPAYERGFNLMKHLMDKV